MSLYAGGAESAKGTGNDQAKPRSRVYSVWLIAPQPKFLDAKQKELGEELESLWTVLGGRGARGLATNHAACPKPECKTNINPAYPRAEGWKCRLV